MTFMHHSPEDYQFIRYAEQIAPGQVYEIRNICLDSTQFLEVSCDVGQLTFVVEDQTGGSSEGCTISGTSTWTAVKDRSSDNFRRYNLYVSNLGSEVGIFYVYYSCYDLIVDPGPTYGYPSEDTSVSTTWRCYQGGVYQGEGPPYYFRVHDEVPGYDDNSYIELQTNAAGQNVYFGFTTFYVSERFIIDSVKIYYRVKSNSPAEIRSGVICGGTTYDSIDPGVTVEQTWTTYSYQYFYNPQTGVNWTVGDFSGESAHALSGFGLDVISGSDIEISQCYLEVVSVVPLPHGQHTLYLYPIADFGHDPETYWYSEGENHDPPYWDKVNDPVGDDEGPNSTFVMHGSVSGSGYIGFTFTPPSISSWLSVQSVTLHCRVNAQEDLVIKAVVWTGGIVPIYATRYDNVDPGFTSLSVGFQNVSYTFSVNPATGVAWTPDDLGKISTDFLAGFGVSVTIGNFNMNWCYLEVTYTT
jgi:hypothetical protein